MPLMTSHVMRMVLQLVLLLGEDGAVFACEDELLHLVARNLRDLLQSEMAFPGIETFKLGECFEEPVRSQTYIIHLLFIPTCILTFHQTKSFF